MLHVPVRLSVKCEYYNIPGFVKLNPSFCLLGNDFVLPHGLRNALKTATTDSKKKVEKNRHLVVSCLHEAAYFCRGKTAWPIRIRPNMVAFRTCHEWVLFE